MKAAGRSTLLILASLTAIVLGTAMPRAAQAIDFAAMKCGELGEPACSVAPATYKGKKPAGCPKGTFFDLIDGGSCWSCPSGTVRGVTAVNSSSACLRPPGERVARAKRHGKGKGLLGTDCPKGQFWDPNGNCYSCPGGFKRTVAPVTAKNACTRWYGPSSVRATKRKSLACPGGTFADPIRGGSCWSCPRGYVRTLAHVEANNACAAGNLVAGVSPVTGICADGLVNSGGRCAQRNNCGALGQRPCLLVERIPSCDAGLAEDFLKNRCVEDKLAAAACGAVIDAFWAGQDLATLLGHAPPLDFLKQTLIDNVGGAAALDREVTAIKTRATGELRSRFEAMAPEAASIVTWLEDPAHRGTLRKLFSAQNVCSGSIAAVDQMLRELNLVPASVLAELDGMRKQTSPVGIIWGALSTLSGIEEAHAVDWRDPLPLADPNWRHLFLGYQITLAGAKGLGGGVSIMGVTDLRGNGGFYLMPMLQAVTNKGAGVDARLVVLTSANMNTFEGLGYGIGVTFPPPKVDKNSGLNLGVDLIIEPPFVLRGMGFGGGAGKSALPFDAAISGAYAFALNRYCATTPEQSCENCSCLD